MFCFNILKVVGSQQCSGNVNGKTFTYELMNDGNKQTLFVQSQARLRFYLLKSVSQISNCIHCLSIFLYIFEARQRFKQFFKSQGKYVPPEREDIVTEEADTEKSDDVSDPDTDQNARQEATIEEIDDDANEKESEQINSAQEADIDLD